MSFMKARAQVAVLGIVTSLTAGPIQPAQQPCMAHRTFSALDMATRRPLPETTAVTRVILQAIAGLHRFWSICSCAALLTFPSVTGEWGCSDVINKCPDGPYDNIDSTNINLYCPISGIVAGSSDFLAGVLRKKFAR